MTHEIPNFSNFYSVVFTKTIEEIKDVLENNGWKIRNSSWTEFECHNEWSELHLSNHENEVLLNGSIANASLENIISLFKTIDAKFQAELYDENKNIISEISNR